MVAAGFRRSSTYRAATLAGIFTNTVFGFILCGVFAAVWAARPDAGGYDATQAITYVWIGQGLLAVVEMFGGGSPDDLAERIRSGAVASDLARPASVLGWYLCLDLGRACFQLLTRAGVPLVIGALVFGLTTPTVTGALLAAVAVPVAVVVSFALRLLPALTAFWLLDTTGPRLLGGVLTIFFSGLTVPLVLLPDGLREVTLLLPWAALLQTPADLWLGRVSGVEAVALLGVAIGWAVVLLGACRLVLAAGERRVVVQGG